MTSPEKMELKIHAFEQDHSLILEINNTGKWNSREKAFGTGINNVKERLKNAYSNNFTFDIIEKQGWINVIIQVNLIAINESL